MSLVVGARLGHYDVTAKIGEGGIGEVHRARDTKLDRDVALRGLACVGIGEPAARRKTVAPEPVAEWRLAGSDRGHGGWRSRKPKWSSVAEPGGSGPFSTRRRLRREGLVVLEDTEDVQGD